MLETENLEHGEEIRIRDTFGAHLAKGVGVDNLLPEGAAREIRALRNVEDGMEGWLVDRASIDRPETTKNAE